MGAFDDLIPAKAEHRSAGAFDDLIPGGVGREILAAEQALSRAQMTHAAPTQKPRDMYAQQAGKQSFLENLSAGAGGAAYGMGYLGPKSLIGMDSPGEVADWKASMAGLGTTVGGTIGQVAGYSAPAAVAAPFVGASVPAAAAISAVEGAMLPAETMSERGFNTVASAAGGTLGQSGGNALARRTTESAAKRAAEVASKRGQNAVRDATLAASQQAGYVVPPSYAGTGLWPRFFEGLSGKYKTNQAAQIKNQRVTNTLAKRDLGIPEDQALSDALLSEQRRALAQPYRDIAALPQKPTVRAASNYTDWDSPVQSATGFDPAAALEQLKQARFDSKTYWKHFDRTGDPESLVMARKLDGNVNQLEAGIENHAMVNGRPDLAAQLKEARRKIAKTYTVERALNDATGDVDATVLARMLKNNDPVTGDLETAGRFGMGFSDVARVPKSGDANPFTVLDFWSGMTAGGLGGIAGGGPVGATMAIAPPLARLASRYSLLSGPVQRSIVQPKYSLGSARLVAPALNSRLAKEMAQGAGIYGYGVQPGLQE